ncbi:MAG: pyruvate formate lyase family protein [Candidatus Cyclobacteriaceae bacterium M3_2C_046]
MIAFDLHQSLDISQPNDQVSYMEWFTMVYQAYQEKDTAQREAAIHQVQFPAIMQALSEPAILAGTLDWPILCFAPQTKAAGGIGFGYCFDLVKAHELLNKPSLSQENQKKLHQLIAFWKNENSAAQTRHQFSREMQKAFPSDNWLEEPGVAFPLYRMAGTQLNYKKLLRLGISGLYREIEQFLTADIDPDSQSFYQALQSALDTLIRILEFYAIQASGPLKSSLLNLTKAPPSSFREAIQLVHLYALMSGSLNYGRMDDYLGEFLIKDLAEQKINRQEALDLLVAFWSKIIERGHVHDCRLTVGGKGRENPEAADHFALLALEASEITNDVLPQLSLRLHQDMDQQLKQKAFDLLEQGLTFPMLYNDEVNIPAVSKAFQVDLQEAEQYIPYGCGEFILDHRSVGSPNGIINLLKALEITLHHGKDPVSGQIKGISAGKIRDFNDFDQLWQAYQQQVDYFLEQLALQQDLEYQVAGKTAPFLYLSLLYDDCLPRGLGLFQGGVRYLGGTMESYGNTNTADSLLAIKKLVFEQKKITLPKLLEILQADFSGYEQEKSWLQNVPKYGNDDPEADQMARQVHQQVCLSTQRFGHNTSLDTYLVVVINNSANAILGRTTMASADGRSAFTAMANGNNPSPGSDRQGLTAFLNSLVKLDSDIHAGTVQNMKFSREMFTKYRSQTLSLLETYFAKGGSQAMISVVSRQDLENAMKAPEKYANLMVRVGGFSARFVELEPDVQAEILQRTLY